MVLSVGGVVLVAAGLLLMHRFTGRDGLRRSMRTIAGLGSGAACIVVGAFVIVWGLQQ